MGLGFLFAVMAAFCSATAAILQAIGARQIAATSHLDPGLLFRLVRCRPYATGLVLDGASAVLIFLALRSAPIFAVQAVGAANLSVVALLTMVVLRVRLRWSDWLAIGAIVAGLLLLVLAARPGPPPERAPAIAWGLLAGVVTLAGAANVFAPRLNNAAVPGLLAGLSFGGSALGGRLLGGAGSVGVLLTSPALYALMLAGLSGLLLYATALQRGSVTVASAMSILGQTVAPAVVGWVVLGDGVRPGYTPVAGLGFVLAVAGAVGLARHSQPHHTRDE